MMNSDPSRMPAEQENTFAKILRKKLLELFTNRWGWKLTSLILAICLWGGLISQDTTLPRDKTFTDVKINVTGTTAMKNNGFIVVDGLNALEDIQIKVRVPQKYYNSVTASTYNVRVDLSQIKAEGEQILKISSASSSSLYGTVTDMSVTEIPVTVERYVARSRIPVEVRFTGEAPEGFMPILSGYDPATVDIAGPASVVNAVASCVVTYDYGLLPAAIANKRISCDFVFEAADGTPLSTENLTVTSQSGALQNVNLDIDVYARMEVPIETGSLIIGEPAPGYEVADITILPRSITIAGTDISRYLNGEKIYPYGAITITGKKQDVISTMALRTPSSMKYVSDSMVTVIISIEPTLAGVPPETDDP